MGCSVYWIRNVEHTDLMTQGYVGITNRFDRRMWEHFKLDGNRYLKFAIKKYGWDRLVKSQLLISTEEYCLEMERKLRPEDKIGWNIVAGGGKPPSSIGKRYKLSKPVWNVGISMTPESAEKVSKSIKKLWENPDYRKHMSDAHKGQSSAMLGKKHSPESIEKMRLAHTGVVSKKKGRLLTAEQKKNLSDLSRLNAWTCPHCQKFGYSVGAKNRWHFDNCKFKEQSCL
jgi:predicted GIY-YIG superfamily endonuclease